MFVKESSAPTASVRSAKPFYRMMDDSADRHQGLLTQELYFDHLYHCLSCINATYLFFSTSKISKRPVLGNDGKFYLRVEDFIYMNPGDRHTIDPGVRVKVYGCPVVLAFERPTPSNFVLDYMDDQRVTSTFDVYLNVSVSGEEPAIVAPGEFLCSLRITPACQCERVTPVGVLDITPSGPIEGMHEERFLYVSVSGFRFLDYTGALPVERIFRWIYSDYPFIRKVTPYSSATGVKSTEISGIFEFYRSLFGVSGYNRVIIFTDTNGVHDLFQKFCDDPTTIPGRYRSCFQRTRFLNLYRKFPAVIKNTNAGSAFVTSAYRAFLTKWTDHCASRSVELIDPKSPIFTDLVRREFPGITLKCMDKASF